MYKAIVFLVVLGLSYVYGKEYTPVLPCGPNKEFKNVAVTTQKGVCTKLPCVLKMGEEITVNIEFTNKKRVEKIVSKCKATVMGMNIDFQIPDADKGCDHLVQGKCPAEPNSDLELKLKVPVTYPSFEEMRAGIDAKMEVSVLDQNNERISCFILNAQVRL